MTERPTGEAHPATTTPADDQTATAPSSGADAATEGAAKKTATKAAKKTTAKKTAAKKAAAKKSSAKKASAKKAPAKKAAAATGEGGQHDAAPDEMPERIFEGRPKDPVAAERALVKRPQIGDTMPAPPMPATPPPSGDDEGSGQSGERTGGGGGRSRSRRRRGGRGRGGGGRQGGGAGGDAAGPNGSGQDGAGQGTSAKGSGAKGSGGKGSGSRGGGKGGGGRGRGGDAPSPVEAVVGGEPPELDEKARKRRGGRERNGKPVGRYLMCVNVRSEATQIAVLEGRNLIEHYVSRPSDDVFQIHGNIYLGKVQNVLPGMEAAFIDIGTPKNAVLYRGDVQYDAEDIEEKSEPRIEELLKARQSIICQVTKNPIGHKGARLTQEVSLPGRFVVLIPNSTTYGISKRLADDERKRLRSILDEVRPEGHGLIVRTAAEGISADEIQRDVERLSGQWAQISELAAKVKAPALLYREPDMAVRVIREEFNADYRGVVIDDPDLHAEVSSYVSVISPALAQRVQLYDTASEPLSLFERHHVAEQLEKALDRKVWLPSGGSLIIEHTEALTVIDVNTGKNVGNSSLEETVTDNNCEAAVEIARQLRLRDIGGIIVIDFIDMEKKANRERVISVFRDALARDKTRTQVFDISELGIVEMTRKRIGEGLLESFSTQCDACEGRGVVIERSLLG